MTLKELKTIPNLTFDLRYATSNNVTGEPIYSVAHAFLHEKAYEKLQRAVELAKEIGLTFKIFDAYRPPEAQQALWDYCPDPTYITPPEKGSPHTRGIAVDLTLLDAEGNELDMGAEFDEFDDIAHHGSIEISKEAQRNRFLLMGIMTTAGWDFFKNEWWHYQLFDSKSYPLIANDDAPIRLM